MSTWIDVGRYRVPLSSILTGTQDRAHHLGRVYRESRRVTCLCVPGGIEMGVACRSLARNIYYLYHLHRGDQALHHPSCAHFALQQPASSTPSVAQNPPTAQTPPLGTAAETIDRYLQTLVVSAGLHEWRPAFLHKRTFYTARLRLLDAARSIAVPPGPLLGDGLYCPPIWDPSQKEAIDQAWQRFIDLLHSRTQSDSHAYVLGLLRSLEVRPHWSAPRLMLASHHTPFWLDLKPTLIPFPADTGHHWLVLLKIEPSRARYGYTVVDGSAYLLSSNWIPCSTSPHAHLADELARSKSTFTASMPHDENTSWAFPDFVVDGPDGCLYRHGLFGPTRVQQCVADPLAQQA